jgi:hypothetical protein
MTCQSVLAVWNKYGTLATSRKQQPFFISDIGSVCTRDEYAIGIGSYVRDFFVFVIRSEGGEKY